MMEARKRVLDPSYQIGPIRIKERIDTSDQRPYRPRRRRDFSTSDWVYIGGTLGILTATFLVTALYHNT